MKSTIEKIWYFLFSNIMWLYIIMGICTVFLGIYPMTFQLFMIVSTLFFFHIMNKIKMTNMLDLFVMLFIIYILINSLLIDYPHKWRLWYSAVFTNVLPMLFYYIAKSTKYEIEDILRKATIPIIIAMIFGLIVHYTRPGWYVAMVMRQIYDNYGGNTSDEVLMSMFRLSSFWSTPYVIGYAAIYYANYLLYNIFSANNNTKTKRNYFIIFILTAVVILLTQFRATIYSLVLSLGYMMFFAKNKIRPAYIIITILASMLTVSVLFNESTAEGEYFKERMTKGLDKEHLEERLEHTGGDIDLNTTFGQGFGRHGGTARQYGYWAIQDSEYQKVAAELGAVGMIPFIGIIACALLMSFRKKQLQLEFTIILFFAIAFMGSSCISSETTFPFIFWYVLGRISLKNSNSYKKTIAR